MNLSQEEILWAINTRNISGVLLREKNFTNLLGEIEFNETGDHPLIMILIMSCISGQIVGAKVTSITLLGKVNLTALKEFGSAGSRGDVIDKLVIFIAETHNTDVLCDQVHLRLRGGDGTGGHRQAEPRQRCGDLCQHCQDAL